MFSRKQKTGPPSAGLPFVQPQATPDPYDSFRYNPDNMLSFQCGHPHFQGYTTWYGLKEGGMVSLVTPFSAPEALKFRLSDLPYEKWVQLTDAQQRPLPLALFIDDAGPIGQWLK